MKRQLLLKLPLLLLIVCCTVSVACTTGDSQKEPEPSAAPSEGDQSPQSPAGIVEDSGSIWDNMPLAFRKTEVARGSYSVPAQRGEWAVTEWRYYHTPEALPTMRQYFQREMPNNGWDEAESDNEVEMSLSYWTGNSGEDGAMVWMVPDEPGTFIALARSTR